MSKNKATNFEEFEAVLLQDSGILKEYLDLEPKYDRIRSQIKYRNQYISRFGHFSGSF